jgi:hypothetical protein
MSTHRRILFALFVIMVAPMTIVAQGPSPLLDKVVESIEATNPKWQVVYGFCTCPALVRSEVAYAFGSMRYRKLSSPRRVSINIAYVPTPAIARDSMTFLRDQNDTAPYRDAARDRENYNIAEEAYLWSYTNGTAALYFRSGAAIAELFGARADVQFFARTLARKWAR